MEKLKYNIQIEKLCKLLGLGNVLSKPLRVSGGFLHKMYSVNTTSGKYAVKALNPEIISRNDAKNNTIISEKISNYLSNKILVSTALVINNNVIHCLDDQNYMIFNWINGIKMNMNDITLRHCYLIGSILSNIHSVDWKDINIDKNCDYYDSVIDWTGYLNEGKSNNSLWVKTLDEIINSLYVWNELAIKSYNSINSNLVISHRDMDPKNVLWDNENPIIIDWEAAGYVNPMQDLIEVALYWSESLSGNIGKNKFMNVINGYKENRQINYDECKKALYAIYLNKLQWLEYSLKQSLALNCVNEDDKEIGTSEVFETIRKIQNYSDMIKIIEQWI